MFKNPFSFDGRIRRTEYGLSYLIYMATIIMSILIAETGSKVAILCFFLYIPAVWFLLAQGAKRCHDRSNSGWYQLIPFYTFWMLFADSDEGPNEYGDNPKGIGNMDETDEPGQSVTT